ncbi:MAG TPA: peptide chain release factor 2 [Candidatus Marinimicrobia bacterium]|nr:peptide chain release factor 2 [Candidatus Neomarinimicrobiota bacterium]
MLNDIQVELDNIAPRIDELRRFFDVESKKNELNTERQKTTASDFWSDPAQAQTTLQKIRGLESEIDNFENLVKYQKEITDFVDLAAEEQDDSVLAELEKMVNELISKVEQLELETMLDEPDDEKNAILTIHPGAGGTESQDWAHMLMRMYLRWMERSGMEADVISILDGEEAGIKEVTIEVKGRYAYGYLKAEAGIHRLVRISPFDANHRRHTSFASVFVYPAIEDDISVEINQDDLRIDTFRASGAGGQHVNKTSSAVRITHIPTGIVVQCQNERSQFKNKDSAMKILRARLYQLKKEEKNKEKMEIEKNKKDISWGNQIRSYVFQPYTLVKDHRTKYETGNIQAVMDGEIDEFLRQYLLFNVKNERAKK